MQYEYYRSFKKTKMVLELELSFLSKICRVKIMKFMNKKNCSCFALYHICIILDLTINVKNKLIKKKVF